MIDPGEFEGLTCPMCQEETLNYTNFEAVRSIATTKYVINGEGVQCKNEKCGLLVEHNVVGKVMEFLKLDTPEYDPADDEDCPPR